MAPLDAPLISEGFYSKPSLYDEGETLARLYDESYHQSLPESGREGSSLLKLTVDGTLSSLRNDFSDPLRFSLFLVSAVAIGKLAANSPARVRATIFATGMAAAGIDAAMKISAVMVDTKSFENTDGLSPSALEERCAHLSEQLGAIGKDALLGQSAQSARKGFARKNQAC